MIRLMLAAICSIVLDTLTLGEDQCGSAQRLVTNFGDVVSDARTVSEEHRQVVTASRSVQYIRLLFRPNSNNSDWTLRIYDAFGRPLQAVAGSAVPGSHEFWSKRLSAPSLVLVMETESGASVEAVEHIEMPQNGSGQYYSTKIPGAPDWKTLYGGGAGPLQQRVGESVGMLFASVGTRATGYSTWACSGVVVGTGNETLLLTAAHCGAPEEYKQISWSNTILSRMFVDLSWDGDQTSREYQVAGKAYVDWKLDLALIPIRSADGDAGPPAAIIRSTRPRRLEPLFMIHHPAAAEKQISESCRVEELRENAHVLRFAHLCDSEGGSSGAPIFDQFGSVVGIHVDGFQKLPNGHCDRVNKAVSSTSIIDFMRGSAAHDPPHS
jgi:V8-like Glu-specific endopeptidase